MTIEQYNKRVNNYNNELNSLRSAMLESKAYLVSVDDDGTNDVSAYRADSMYRADLMLSGLRNSIKRLSDELTILNAKYFEILLDK